MSEYAIAKARDRFTELVREAEEGRPVSLTRRGQPVAVILSIRDYRRLTSGGADFWNTLSQFRVDNDLAKLGIEPRIFEEGRDRVTGREVDW